MGLQYGIYLQGKDVILYSTHELIQIFLQFGEAVYWNAAMHSFSKTTKF